MGGLDRKRHQLRGLVAGVAEHQPLVSGTLFGIQAFALIYAHSDVLRLLIDGRDHRARAAVEADLRVVVADLLQGLAHHRGHIHVG